MPDASTEPFPSAPKRLLWLLLAVVGIRLLFVLLAIGFADFAPQALLYPLLFAALGASALLGKRAPARVLGYLLCVLRVASVLWPLCAAHGDS